MRLRVDSPLGSKLAAIRETGPTQLAQRFAVFPSLARARGRLSTRCSARNGDSGRVPRGWFAANLRRAAETADAQRRIVLPYARRSPRAGPSNGHLAPLQVAQLGSAARWSKQTGTFASRNPFARCSQPSTAQSATSNDRPPWRPNCSTSLTLSEIAPMPHRRGLMLLPLQNRNIRPGLSALNG